MTAPSSRGFVLGLFLLALAFHLAIVSQDFSVLAKNGFLYDDSFYAFKIAQNIAHGQGVTFDGVHPTNGFQPLYVCLLVPVFWLSGSNLVAPIYAALMLCALMTAFGAVLLYKILLRYVSDRAALIAAVLWAFSPVVTRQTANGLETSLAILMFAGIVYFYLTHIRPVDRPSTGNLVIMGALVGLGVLARVDQVFLGLAILLDYLLVLRRRRLGISGLRVLTVAGVVGVVVYSPWILFNYLSMGTFVQDSGVATRFLSIAYAPFFDLGPAEMLDSGPSAAFIWGHVMKAFAVLKIAPPTHVFFRALEKAGMSIGMPELFGVLATIAGFALIALLVYVARKQKDDEGMRQIGELRFLVIAAIALMAAYSFYVFGVFFFIRYMYPIYFIACLFAAFYVHLLLKRVSRGSGSLRAATVIVFSAYIAAFAYMSYTSAFRSQPTYYFYDVAKWIDQNTYEDETIGVFQGGAIGYLSTRKVINLDGKVNRDALEALREKRITSYLKENDVDVVLDNSNVLSLFLGASRNPTRLASEGYEKIMHGSSDGVPGWSAYRINGHVTQAQPGRFSAPKASSALR